MSESVKKTTDNKPKILEDILLKKFDALSASIELKVSKIMNKVDSHEKFLKDILGKMESIDEMMGLILVAIRQNEYLQAYYPEQHGFPAGKYAGLHPAKLMEKAQ